MILMNGLKKSVFWKLVRYLNIELYYLYKHIVPIEWWLKHEFKRRVGYWPNIKHPKTFNEKLQWIKLYDHNPLYTKMVDKFEAKKYVSDIIGDEYIIPTLGVWNYFEEIDFDALPTQFVLKCTHDSGSIVICKDKNNFDKYAARAVLNKGLHYNYYYKNAFEWPYKDVKPRIIAEKYMSDDSQDNSGSLTDYKFMCFGGKVKCSFTCTGRNTSRGLHVTFYDENWQIMPFERHYPAEKNPIPKPQNYNKMVQLSERLATTLKFARIDFYEINGKIYFGEITFFPGNGMEEFTPQIWDYRLGDWLIC